MKEIILTSNALNSYGFRVLTEGLDISQYLKNPVILWMHNRSDHDNLPIGRMENIHLEADKLIGSPKFDLADPFAAEIARKYESGFISMASIGFAIQETSKEKELMLDGQVLPTVTKSKLIEVSLVDIGANDDALALSFNNSDTFNLTPNTIFHLAGVINNNNIIKNNLKMSKIAQQLHLDDNATEQQIIDNIAQLQSKAEKADALQESCNKLNQQLADYQQLAEQQRIDNIKKLVTAAVADGRVLQSDTELFINIGDKNGIEALERTLSLFKPAVKLNSLIQPPQSTTLTWDEADRTNQLLTIRRQNPELYNHLYKQKFGVLPSPS